MTQHHIEFHGLDASRTTTLVTALRCCGVTSAFRRIPNAAGAQDARIVLAGFDDESASNVRSILTGTIPSTLPGPDSASAEVARDLLADAAVSETTIESTATVTSPPPARVPEQAGGAE